MEYWTICGTIASIVAALAASIAAYFAVLSRPRKVKGIAVEIESVERLQLESHEYEIVVSVANLDYNNLLNDAMVAITAGGITLIRIVPNSSGGLLMMPNIVLDADSINISCEKLKPRTKIVGKIKIKAEQGLYNLAWYGYGPNLKQIKGNLVLKLNND